MKSVKLSCLSLLGIILMLTGCNSMPDTTPVQPKTTEVTGTGDKQIAVVEELYNITARETSKGSGVWLLTTRIKFNTMSEELKVTDAPVLMLLDETDQPIADAVFKLGNNAVDTRSKTLFQEFAVKTDGTEQSFTFYLNLADKDQIIDILKKTKSFVVEVVGEGIGSGRATASSDTDEETDATAPSGVEVILPPSIKNNVEVVSASDVEIDSDSYPSISVTFKLSGKANTAALTGSTNQMWIVGVPQDASGASVRDIIPNYGEWRTDDSDGNEFKEFLEGEVGSTITMTFTGDNCTELFEKDQDKIDAGRNKVEKASAKVKKLKLKITN